MTKRKWDILPKSKRDSFVKELITFFEQERNEKLGIIAGEEILDFFLQNIGEDIYNKGVEDCKELLKKGFEDLEIDLDTMMK